LLSKGSGSKGHRSVAQIAEKRSRSYQSKKGGGEVTLHWKGKGRVSKKRKGNIHGETEKGWRGIENGNTN